MPNALSNVDTWLYHIGSVDEARLAELAAAPVDLIVVDREDADLEPFTAEDVTALKGTNDKLVISYLSIGEAETYRDYWDPTWEETPPSWLAEVNPEWTDNINVKFWDTSWQEIILADVEAAVMAGFNGLYLDIIDSYAYWEDRKPNKPEGYYRGLMVDFVEAIRAKAEEVMGREGLSQPFAIIGQNGEDLALDPDYLAAVDGIGKEDLYFYYPNGKADKFGPVPKGWLTGSKELLEAAEAAGTEVLVVEYVPKNQLNGAIKRLKKELAYLDDVLDAPLYLASNRGLDKIHVVIDREGKVHQWGSDGADKIKGTAFDDLVDAGSGDDVVKAGKGHDWIDAGIGHDKVAGGAGADTFTFDIGDERLVITDFGRGADELDLSAFEIADFDALSELWEKDGKHLVITLDTDELVLKWTRPKDLDEGDFLL